MNRLQVVGGRRQDWNELLILIDKSEIRFSVMTIAVCGLRSAVFHG